MVASSTRAISLAEGWPVDDGLGSVSSARKDRKYGGGLKPALSMEPPEFRKPCD
jgi:hypothetical protein